MTVISRDDISQLEKVERLNLINSCTGYKSANLIATKSLDGAVNVAIFSSITHLGSNPALIGFIVRPTTVPRNTYKNIKATGYFTVNHITEEMIGVYHSYEKGLMSTDDFINFYHDKFGIKKTDLVNAWNAILLDFPKRRLTFLKEISASKKYRLFLLSNTNDLHIRWVEDSLGKEFYNEFKNSF